MGMEVLCRPPERWGTQGTAYSSRLAHESGQGQLTGLVQSSWAIPIPQSGKG